MRPIDLVREYAETYPHYRGDVRVQVTKRKALYYTIRRKLRGEIISIKRTSMPWLGGKDDIPRLSLMENLVE